MTSPLVSASPVLLIGQAEAAAGGIRVRAGADYVRVRAGLYAPRDEWGRLSPWDRYRARVHAFHYAHPDAILAYESAAAVLGLPVFGEPRDIHVYDPGRTRSRRFGDVSVHTTESPRPIERRDGVLLTTPAATAVGLMRVLPPAFGLAVADAVLSRRRADAASIEELRGLADAQRTRRGRARVALLLPMAAPSSESAGETVSRAVAHWLGYEEPELQVDFVAEGCRDQVDFFWRRAATIGESDGYGKYVVADAADTVARVVSEKQREDRLRRQVRSFTRWDWGATLRVDPLDERLARAGIARVRPPQQALLATLRHHPRSLRT